MSLKYVYYDYDCEYKHQIWGLCVEMNLFYFVKLVHVTNLASVQHTEKLNRSLKWEN